MDNFTLFVCGLLITLISGMGVITSEVFLGYKKFMEQGLKEKEKIDDKIEQLV